MKKIFSAILSVIIVAFCVSFPTIAYDLSETDVAAMENEKEPVDEAAVYLTENTKSSVSVIAKSAVLMDVNTGTLLYSMNENEKLYPASVTKIMSMLLVCEAISQGRIALNQSVTISESAAGKGGSQIWLEPGETMTVHELLKATAVYSANDACCALGELIAGSEEAFVDMMNKKAASLGMKNTHFDNCSGLDDDTDTHLTTAYDVALMSRALLNYDFITDYTTIWMDSLRDGKTQLVNTNKLVRYYSGATGLKTGTTEKAGCCVSASAKRDGLHLISVVMGADNSADRFNGARTMLDWGFANFEIYTPSVDASLLTPVRVAHGVLQHVNVSCNNPPEMLLNKGQSSAVSQSITLPEETEAPVAGGDVLGKISFILDGKIISESDIIASVSSEKITFSSALQLILRSLTDK